MGRRLLSCLSWVRLTTLPLSLPPLFPPQEVAEARLGRAQKQLAADGAALAELAQKSAALTTQLQARAWGRAGGKLAKRASMQACMM